MRVLLAVYLAVAQSVAGAVAFAPPPPNIAEVSTAILKGVYRNLPKVTVSCG
jgi:hypothetical protein